MLLALDLGTTNVKAFVTDLRGRPLARGSCAVQLFRLPGGGVEQDLEEIWRATISAIRQAVSSVDGSRIEAIGVSSQGGALQLIDAGGRPLGRVISWLDQRGRPFDEALTRELGKQWFLQRIVHGGSWLSIGQILRLAKEHPEWLESPNRVGFVGDLILSRLCGSPAHDGSSAALTLLYNPTQRAYDSDLLSRLGLAPERLPPILSPRGVAGGLLPGVAAETGLLAGTPISPAIHDQYASALGVGATRPGTVMVGTGTAWVLLHISAQLPTPVTDEAFVCHHVAADTWGQILSMVNGGSALSWALELTGQSGTGEGIDQLLAAAPPGSDGLRFWPFLTPFGASGLSPGTRGRFAGLQLHHSPPHIIRAVVEGLGYELNRYLNLLQTSQSTEARVPEADLQSVASPVFNRQTVDTASTIDRLVMGGGAAASPVTPQILADIAGLPLRCFAGSDATLTGAAILARGLLEPSRSLAALADEMNPPSREVNPGPNQSFYQQEFQGYLASLPLLP